MSLFLQALYLGGRKKNQTRDTLSAQKETRARVLLLWGRPVSSPPAGGGGPGWTVKVDAEGPVTAAAVSGGGAGRTLAAVPRGVRPVPASPGARPGPCRAAEGGGRLASPGGDSRPASPGKGWGSGCRAAAGAGAPAAGRRRSDAERAPGSLPILFPGYCLQRWPGQVGWCSVVVGRLPVPRRCGVSVAWDAVIQC